MDKKQALQRIDYIDRYYTKDVRNIKYSAEHQKTQNVIML